MGWIDNSRVLAIFAVVSLHVAAAVITSSPIGSTDWWIANAYDSLVRWCVPAFVMISGALLLDSKKQEDLKTFFSKRLSRILIPIVFWSAFFLLWNTLWGLAEGHELKATHLVWRILDGRPHFHMWFLYMIGLLYVFTPFLRKVVASSKRSELSFLIASLFVLAALTGVANGTGQQGTGLFLNSFLPYIPYFLFGYFASTSTWRVRKAPLLGLFALAATLTALGCFYLASEKDLRAGLYFYGYLSVTVIPMSLAVIYLLKLWKEPVGSASMAAEMASLSFGVYLVHPVFLKLIDFWGFGPATFAPWLSIPLISVITFLLSLGVAWGISKTPYLRRVI